MTTVSSPWKLGRNLSPRRISAWFRGLKRHSTLILHSATASVMITQYNTASYIRTTQDGESRPELELMASEKQKKILLSAYRSAGVFSSALSVCERVLDVCVVLLESVAVMSLLCCVCVVFAVMLGWRGCCCCHEDAEQGVAEDHSSRGRG